MRWTGTAAKVLGTLGGRSSVSIGINASGQVAGSAYTTGNNAEHAVRWTGTTATDLGTLGGSLNQGYGINASGDVIGMSNTTGDASYNAFLYTGETMYDLNTLLLPGSGVTNLYVHRWGNNINDLGQIAVSGTIDGQSHALLLTPVPVPESSLILMMMMLGSLGLLRLRTPRPAHTA